MSPASGLPRSPSITSSPVGGEGDRYTLTWVTETYYPVTEVLVKYRRVHAWPVSTAVQGLSRAVQGL